MIASINLRTFTCCLLLGGAVIARPDSSPQLKLIQSVLWPPGQADTDNDIPSAKLGDRSYELAVMEAGNDALPLLKKGFQDKTHQQRRSISAFGLALIASDESVAILEAGLRAKPDPEAEQMLCFALAAGNSQRNNDVLKQYLGERWIFVREQAAFSLGIRRDQSAIPLLKLNAQRDQGYISGVAAEFALRRMQNDPSKVSLPETLTGDQAPILPILQDGFPTAGSKMTFNERGRQRTWIFHDNQWDILPLDVNNNAPELSFKVYLTENRQKALVTMVNSMNATVYLYVLTKDKIDWKITGMRLEGMW